MKCVIPAPNAKIFAKGFQCLAKIGDVLYIEALPTGLSLRTINNTKSALAKMLFLPNFFSSYEILPDSEHENDNSCRLSMKSCLQVFKNMKLVEHCIISLDVETSKIIIQLKCRFETVKTHYIRILQYQTLDYVVKSGNIQNQISASFKIFNDIVSNFQFNEEEITIETSPKMIIVRNYINNSHVDRRIMKSQFRIQSNQFDQYSIEDHTTITFCLRELRALLNFAEILNLNVILNFETAGKPVNFTLENSETFTSTLLMATQRKETNCLNSSLKEAEHIKNSESNKRAVEKNNKSEVSRKKVKTGNVFNDNELFCFVSESNTNCIDPIRVAENVESAFSLDIEQIDLTEKSNMNSKNLDSEDIQIIFQEDTNIGVNMMNITENVEVIPRSPINQFKQNKRMIFRRCFEATFNPNALPGSSQVLAENSDSD